MQCVLFALHVTVMTIYVDFDMAFPGGFCLGKFESQKPVVTPQNKKQTKTMMGP